MHRRGVGKALLEALIEACTKGGFRQMIAVIGDSKQAASIGVHEATGFKHVGVFENVGYKFDRWLDTRADAARARARGNHAAVIDQFATNASERSIERSTRSSSWPRRTTRPLAEITL